MKNVIQKYLPSKNSRMQCIDFFITEFSNFISVNHIKYGLKNDKIKEYAFKTTKLLNVQKL